MVVGCVHQVAWGPVTEWLEAIAIHIHLGTGEPPRTEQRCRKSESDTPAQQVGCVASVVDEVNAVIFR
jgi:hypothetical protein